MLVRRSSPHSNCFTVSVSSFGCFIPHNLPRNTYMKGSATNVRFTGYISLTSEIMYMLLQYDLSFHTQMQFNSSTTWDCNIIGGSSRINCQMSRVLQLMGSHVSPLDDLAAGIMVKNHGDWNLWISRLIPSMALTTQVPNNLVSGKSPKFLGFHEWCSSGILGWLWTIHSCGVWKRPGSANEPAIFWEWWGATFLFKTRELVLGLENFSPQKWHWHFQVGYIPWPQSIAQTKRDHSWFFLLQYRQILLFLYLLCRKMTNKTTSVERVKAFKWKWWSIFFHSKNLKRCTEKIIATVTLNRCRSSQHLGGQETPKRSEGLGTRAASRSEKDSPEQEWGGWVRLHRWNIFFNRADKSMLENCSWEKTWQWW